jgi:HD-GYP domain-containing protein (c-di-GMP phosphodiesterase class II)
VVGVNLEEWARVEEASMSDTQLLLTKIAALRQRLEQAQGLVHDAGSAAASLLPPTSERSTAVDALENRVAAGARLHALLEGSLRQFPHMLGQAGEGIVLPGRLTARAARLLRRGRDALDQLRKLADEPLLQIETDPLARLYREATVMTDMVVRTVQAFPETPSVQLRLCDGLEMVLDVVAERLVTLRAGLQQRQHEDDCLNTLMELLGRIAEGQSLDTAPLITLADRILGAVHKDQALRLLYSPPDKPLRFVAGHSLNVAQVVARVTRHEPEWRNRPLEPIIAALIHDVGMLCVPPAILCHPGLLEDGPRRAVEVHANAGAEALARSLPDARPLAEAAAYHHERLDGTGYPSGLREMQIAPLVRLLSVCDVYTALCSPRPHRLALDTRTALTDTLLLAEQGALDRHQAELLLKLSFYPPGTLVELADGAVGLVVAAHQGRRDLNTPARPVLAVLIDGQGQVLPAPQHVDLAECEGRSILRSLPATERLRVLGKRYPALV